MWAHETSEERLVMIFDAISVVIFASSTVEFFLIAFETCALIIAISWSVVKWANQ